MRGIRILGGGLSGLTAAINLAKEGYDVTVYEKNGDVGMRFHGDLQGLENWSEKKDIIEELRWMNVEVNFDCDSFTHIKLTNCAKTRDIHREKPLYYLVKRGSFPGTLDYGLKEQARKSGARILFKETLPPEDADIVATGPVPSKAPAVVKGITFKTRKGDTAVLALNADLAHMGYSYLFTTKGYGCMCAVVFTETNKVSDCFEKTREFFVKEFNLEIQSPKEVGGIGNFSLKKVYRRGTTLYVGEAAGLQDFLWGFGMRYAIESGYLAAKSIIEDKDYEKMAGKRFGKKSKASFVNRYLWERTAEKDYSYLINNAEFVAKNLHSFHHYNLLQRGIYTLALFNLKKKYPQIME